MIYNHLKNYKIVWKVNSIDEALEDVTHEKWIKQYLDDNDLKHAQNTI